MQHFKRHSVPNPNPPTETPEKQNSPVVGLVSAATSNPADSQMDLQPTSLEYEPNLASDRKPIQDQPNHFVKDFNREQPNIETENDYGPIFDENLRPLVPPGEYTAVCTVVKKYRDFRFKRDVVVLRFRIADGSYGGKLLERFYALRDRATKGCVYLREWIIANNGQMPRRRDRLPSNKFVGKLFRVRVETVKRTWDGADQPEVLRYSKVAAVVELLVTNELIQ